MPRNAAGEAQRLVVLGMGKLGGRELNFSSDVDLIFAYPEEGETDRVGRSNQEFFDRLVSDIVRMLDETTADGFLYRVDLRLRPWGTAGAPALGFAALEEYYQANAREWERYAMIKARPVAGDARAGEALIDLLRPFVWRRYLDYGAFESLREMKRLIEQEERRKGLARHIKLGSGGIREIEFIAQVFQLVRGGREPDLRRRGLIETLHALARSGHLPVDGARELESGYRFLRRVENRLQAWRNEQTHELPGGDGDRLRLARAMDFSTVSAFEETLGAVRRTVRGWFERLVPGDSANDAGGGAMSPGLVSDAAEPEPAHKALGRLGFHDPAGVLRAIAAFREGSAFRLAGERSRERIERLWPRLLGVAGQQPDPELAFARLVGILERIAGRHAYLALLDERPQSLAKLAELAGRSAFIADELGAFPVLLDDLLDPRTLYAVPTRAALAAEIERRLADAAADDVEFVMEMLRQFRHATVLRIAAQDLDGQLTVRQVSDRLSDLAEVVLERVWSLAWRHLARRHVGSPCRDEGRKRKVAFGIVGYGKLGGRELAYGSDLDLVFLHDGTGDDEHTTGEQPVENGVFFARLVQRIIHMLNTTTPSGVLYEVDTRLRPSGASGLLVTSLEAFAEYQRASAWTFEHQALLRARPVAGDAGLGSRFAALRVETLSRPRDAPTLRVEVADMRARMLREHGGRDAAVFDLKQDPGGMADIEFMVQYAALRAASARPGLLDATATVHLLEALRGDGLSEADAGCLESAYLAYRQAVHRRFLDGKDARVGGHEFSAERRAVRAVWKRLMES